MRGGGFEKKRGGEGGRALVPIIYLYIVVCSSLRTSLPYGSSAVGSWGYCTYMGRT